MPEAGVLKDETDCAQGSGSLARHRLALLSHIMPYLDQPGHGREGDGAGDKPEFAADASRPARLYGGRGNVRGKSGAAG